jgi:hypothetical protein
MSHVWCLWRIVQTHTSAHMESIGVAKVQHGRQQMRKYICHTQLQRGLGWGR